MGSVAAVCLAMRITDRLLRTLDLPSAFVPEPVTGDRVSGEKFAELGMPCELVFRQYDEGEIVKIRRTGHVVPQA
eukprot:30297-Eustigmatos_ZCMA.PRE.1